MFTFFDFVFITKLKKNSSIVKGQTAQFDKVVEFINQVYNIKGKRLLLIV